MPIRLNLVTDPAQIDDVLRLRYDVFCTEEGMFPSSSDPRVVDRFDAFSTTQSIIATQGDDVVGSLRITIDSPVGVPADSFYDFRQHLPADAKMMNVSMYCIRKANRSPQIALSLILMASYFAVSNDITHVIAPLNPAVAKLLSRVGFKPLDTLQSNADKDFSFIPVMLDMNELTDFFITFARRNQLYNFLKSYECMLFREGETVLKTGSIGDSAYVIIEGEVEVRHPESNHVLAVMGQGEVFGELALLTDDVRSADVVARSHLRTMVLPKDAFLSHLQTNPDHTLQMLSSIAQRMKSMLQQSEHGGSD
ncbi:N-acyl amino acid synthase FeeM domain-containing protein [Rhodovibrionaceae bacterium A322]